MDNQTGLEKEHEKKDNELDEDTDLRKRIMQEEETWATVVWRKKRNGVEMVKGRTEQQKIQGKEKDVVNGEKRKEDNQKEDMINKLRGKLRYQREYKRETTLTMNVEKPRTTNGYDDN